MNEMEERFWAKVDIRGDDECWVWQGAKQGQGYGNFNKGGGRYARAHRLAYELEVGKIPEGLQIDHLCRNRACVNPRHLEPVTCQENLRRGDLKNNNGNALKTECPTCGGSYTTWQGRRYCTACRNRQKRERRRLAPST